MENGDKPMLIAIEKELNDTLKKGFSAIGREDEFIAKFILYRDSSMVWDNLKKLVDNGSNFDHEIFAVDRAADNPNRISWINFDKALKVSEKEDRPDSILEYRKKSGTMTKIGRFLSKFFELSTREIDIISSFFINKEVNKEFRIVEGDKIAYWYDGDRYAENCDTLNDSCMRNKDYAVFDIYRDNCKMLIYVDIASDLLYGRALLWDAYDKDGNTYKVMDRIYGNGNTVNLFKQWARENGYIHKAEQNYYNKTEFVNLDGVIVFKSLTVKLSSMDYDYAPYIDTFTYGNVSNETLHNRDFSGSIEFDSTGGNFPERECCESCGCTIDRDEAHYVEFEGYYCESCFYDNYSYTSAGNVIPSDEALFCEHCQETEHIDDCTYIEGTGEYVCTYCAERHYVQIENGDWYAPDDTFTCDDCGETHHIDDACTIGDKNYCDDCYSNNVVECNECNGEIEKDDAIEHDGEFYCKDCYDALDKEETA